jgi:cytochrome P450
VTTAEPPSPPLARHRASGTSLDGRAPGREAERGLPPGPSAPPVFQTARWLLRPIAFLESCRRRYGDAFSVRFLGFQSPMVMLSDPESIKALYTSRESGLPPGRSFALQPVMGSRSVLLLEGREHLSRRKLMLPPFHGDRMRAYEGMIAETTRAEVESWPLGTPFPIHPRMQAVTLDVILRAVFGVTESDRLERLRTDLVEMLADMSSARLQFRVPLARRLGGPDPIEEVRRRARAVDELLYAEIAERRADPDSAERSDILSLLAAARFEDGEGMSDEELRDQLVTLLLAGHETTATGLAWTFDLLLRNPATLVRLRSELDEGGEDYLRAVISESLRLRPVVPLAGRRLSKDLRIDGRVLPPGTDVTPAIWLAHTRPESYPDPYSFRPERFLESPPETYAWVPFGGGMRRCLGAAFAEMEMRVVLREVLTRRELHGARAAPARIARRNVTFSPREGTPVTVTARTRPQ